MAYYRSKKRLNISSQEQTGSIVTFNSQYAGLPLKSHKIALTATQSGSGTPSPDNVRPISGWSAINIGSDAKYAGFIDYNQKVAIPSSDVSKTQNNVTITDNRDGTYTVFTTAEGASADTYIATGIFAKYVNHIYYMFGCPFGGSSSTYNWYVSGINSSNQDKGNGVVERVIESGTGYIVPVYIKSGAIITTPITFRPICFDLTAMFGSTKADEIYNMEQQTAGSGVAYVRSLFPNDYYEYNAGTLTTVSAVNGVSNSMFTIQIGSTVYGGEYDARTGVFVSTHKVVVFDGSEQGWTLNRVQSNNAVYITLSDKKAGWQTSICDKMQNVNGCWGNSTDMGLFCDHPSLKRLYFNRPDNSLSLFFTVEDWKTWLSNNNVRVCYELETPTTIQLPPCPIDTLLGENNIWADTGETTVEYIKIQP